LRRCKLAAAEAAVALVAGGLELQPITNALEIA